MESFKIKTIFQTPFLRHVHRRQRYNRIYSNIVIFIAKRIVIDSKTKQFEQ